MTEIQFSELLDALVQDAVESKIAPSYVVGHLFACATIVVAGIAKIGMPEKGDDQNRHN